MDATTVQQLHDISALEHGSVLILCRALLSVLQSHVSVITIDLYVLVVYLVISWVDGNYHYELTQRETYQFLEEKNNNLKIETCLNK